MGTCKPFASSTVLLKEEAVINQNRTEHAMEDSELRKLNESRYFQLDGPFK